VLYRLVLFVVTLSDPILYRLSYLRSEWR